MLPEIQITRLKQSISLLDHLIAFAFFTTTFNKPTLGADRLARQLHIGAPHNRELHQLNGGGIHGGTHIEQERPRPSVVGITVPRAARSHAGQSPQLKQSPTMIAPVLPADAKASLPRRRLIAFRPLKRRACALTAGLAARGPSITCSAWCTATVERPRQ